LSYLCLLLVLPILAEETGEVIGKISDEEGINLPGVTITATSPSLQGMRSAISASDGIFRLPLLPSGIYTLVFELQGFATLSQENVDVSLGKGTTVTIVMKIATLQEQLTVIAETPLIDKTKADNTFNMKADQLANVPVQGRTIQEIMSLTPGVTGVRHNTNTGTSDAIDNYGAGSFRGEGGTGNNYLVDGLSKRGLDDNDPGVRVNYDAWEEVQIISDGFAPGLGQAYGGIINIVTKSGGNKFHGELGGLIWDHRVRATREQQISVAVDPNRSQYNLFGNIGGPLIKDKLWFFISDNFWRRADDGEASSVGWLQIPEGHRRRNTNNLFGKLTFAPFQNHTIAFSGTYDKFLNQTGGFGVPERYVKQDYINYAYRINYKAILSANSLIEAVAGRSSRDRNIGPLSEDMQTPPIEYTDISQTVNNSSSNNMTKEERTDFSLRFTQYLDAKNLGNHEIGVGFLYYWAKRSQLEDRTGKAYDLWNNPNAWGDTFWNGGTTLKFSSPGYPAQLLEYRNMEYFHTGRGFGLYLSDKITIGNVTFMIGVRSETQKLINDIDETLFNWKLDDFISPRLSLAWDITGDGVNVLKLGYGNFTDTMLFDLLPYFSKGSGNAFRVWRWIGPLPTNQDDEAALKNPDNWEYHYHLGSPEAWLEGGYIIDIKEGIQPDRMVKVVAEFNRQLSTNWAAKVRGIYTKHGNMIEDLGMFDYEKTWFLLQNWPEKRRSYLGLEFELQGRIADKFFFNGSYVWSSAKGTTLGAYEKFSNYSVTVYNTVGTFGDHLSGPADSPLAFLDPLTAGFGGLDYGDEGWYGPLQDSCDHVIKMLGTWIAPFNFIVSTNFQLYVGYHWSIHGWNDAFGFYGTFPYGRGTETIPTHAYLDLSIQKDFSFVAGTTVGLRLNVQNLLNSQEVISYANAEGSVLFGQVWGRQFPRWFQFQVLFRF
ncbi:MAG: TonB-dependent receptor, partial [Thermoplasmata archaeon]